jgi:hypothetical protein
MWGAGQLSDRQHRAAKCLLAMWTDAGLNPRVVAPCLYVQDVVFEVEEASEFHGAGPDPLAEDETWRDRFRALMEGLLLGQHPGCRWLCTVQVALDELADGWGF